MPSSSRSAALSICLPLPAPPDVACGGVRDRTVFRAAATRVTDALRDGEAADRENRHRGGTDRVSA